MKSANVATGVYTRESVTARIVGDALGGEGRRLSLQAVLAMHRSRQLILLTLLAVCCCQQRGAAQPYVPGIDVSLFQDAIDWNAVRTAGVEFAVVRASRGETYNDPLFLANMREATKAGVLVGTYHFCNLDTNYGSLSNADAIADATAEANHYLSVIKPYYDAGQMLPPVADVEGFPDFASTAQAKNYTSVWTKQFSDTIYNSLGVKPMVYTSLSKANSFFTTAVSNQNDLWLAWWKSTGTANPPTAADTPTWGAWDFWQWADDWTVNGIEGAVDGDLFNGNRAQLEAKLSGHGQLGGLPGGRMLITDFDGGDQEGYFGQSPTYSGSNTGIASATAERVTNQAHEGTGSQRLTVTPSSATWSMRFLPGLGASPSTPDANLKLETTGSIGFWLKTASTGMSVQLAIDDSDGTERSISKSVASDNQWHLYEWQFDDAAQWNTWLSGSNGAINAATTTIDSILFSGNAASTFYMDTVAHNPNGSLAPIAGDFNQDWLVDGRDLDVWKTAFGATAAGDANNDGVTNGADFLVWQSHQTVVNASAAVAAVPEPAAVTLVGVALLCGWRRRGHAG
ncbi:glycoside hydrolase family 25 protein [Lacipirellula parvula]|nr:glycoside hydrolase family 25 protein [Lacipirellula parvula]